MAVRTLSGARPGGRAAALDWIRLARGGILLALALPPLLLHYVHQPTTTVSVGSASIRLALSDLSAAAIVAGAGLSGARIGWAPLRSARAVWAAAAVLLILVVVATLYGRAQLDGYRFAKHAVTAAKFWEYALLAPAVPLLLRRREDVEALLAGLVAWSSVATVVGVSQFFGAGIASAWSAGRRQPSFLGHHDFAALSGVALALALAAIALRREWPFGRTLALSAGLAGSVGLVVSGSTAGVIGAAAAALAAGVLAARRQRLPLARTGALTAIVLATAGGVVVLRGHDFDQFLRWLGVRTREASTGTQVQTYAQHTLLVYLGWRIFEHRPLQGAGWQGSSDYPSYAPYLAAAHRRFPHTAEQAFPSRTREYGVQNAYVQAAADMGVIGVASFLGLFVVALAVAARVALRGPPLWSATALVAVLWLLVAMGVWSALGLVAGIPLAALTWLAIGLAAAAAAGASGEQV